MRVLFVDNHTEFTAVVCRAFLSVHEVTTVKTVAAGRAALEASSFDVVLVDYDLDDGKGDELVRWVRPQSPRKTLRVIAVSARADGNDALLRAGADGVCAKSAFARIGAVLDAVVQASGS